MSVVPYVKLDCGILDSSLWIDRDSRTVFITMLLMAVPYELRIAVPVIEIDSLTPSNWIIAPDWYGFVPAASTGVITRAGLDIPHGMAALRRLAAPELESRNPRYDGRRIGRVDGGFIILNYDSYRGKDHTSAERSRRYRQRQKSGIVTT